MKKESYLIIDGYNVIHAWKKLNKIAKHSLQDARDKLIEILSNYCGIGSEHIILVFDAYGVKGGMGSVSIRDNITVIFTQEAETADSYIEKTAGKISGNCTVRVVTSDALEQMIIMGLGAYRVSVREFVIAVHKAETKIHEKIESLKTIKNNELISNLDPKTAEWLEQLRQGKSF